MWFSLQSFQRSRHPLYVGLSKMRVRLVALLPLALLCAGQAPVAEISPAAEPVDPAVHALASQLSSSVVSDSMTFFSDLYNWVDASVTKANQGLEAFQSALPSNKGSSSSSSPIVPGPSQLFQTLRDLSAPGPAPGRSAGKPQDLSSMTHIGSRSQTIAPAALTMLRRSLRGTSSAPLLAKAMAVLRKAALAQSPVDLPDEGVAGGQRRRVLQEALSAATSAAGSTSAPSLRLRSLIDTLKAFGGETWAPVRRLPLALSSSLHSWQEPPSPNAVNRRALLSPAPEPAAERLDAAMLADTMIGGSPAFEARLHWPAVPWAHVLNPPQPRACRTPPWPSSTSSAQWCSS